MYQELQLFEDSFESYPVWGTEGEDIHLPTLAVGDIFGHEGLPNIDWRRPPEPGQVFRVVAIKHVFTEPHQLGPDADHLIKVVVALDDLPNRQEMALQEAEDALEKQTRRGDFLSALLTDQAQHNVPALRNRLVQEIVSSMKVAPAHGIEDEAESAWEEAAIILQADGHGLAEMLRGEIQSDVFQALKGLGSDDRITLWLEETELADWFGNDWPSTIKAFDPMTYGQGGMDLVEEKLTKRVLSLLYQHQLPT